MIRNLMHYVIIESSHLFRAGEKFATQLYVHDVIAYLTTEVYRFQAPTHGIVLFGSRKPEQAARYCAALERRDIEVIQMEALTSTVNGAVSHYYQPLPYLCQILDAIPRHSSVVLVGFHNRRYGKILAQYYRLLNLHVAAFVTQNQGGDWMSIPRDWHKLCGSCRELDGHINRMVPSLNRSQV